MKFFTVREDAGGRKKCMMFSQVGVFVCLFVVVFFNQNHPCSVKLCGTFVNAKSTAYVKCLSSGK